MIKERFEVCELCGKSYMPHHNLSFSTQLCGSCEEDLLYWEEMQELQSFNQDKDNVYNSL